MSCCDCDHPSFFPSSLTVLLTPRSGLCSLPLPSSSIPQCHPSGLDNRSGCTSWTTSRRSPKRGHRRSSRMRVTSRLAIWKSNRSKGTTMTTARRTFATPTRRGTTTITTTKTRSIRPKRRIMAQFRMVARTLLDLHTTLRRWRTATLATTMVRCIKIQLMQ